ncbi:MAG: SAM-dependent methyltransferase [Pseudomonadota bacterium]
MTALKIELIRQISRSGPLTVAEYMTQCLLHPEHGYYTNAQPFGRSGDFVTAPEVSQMFGEMLGLALAQAWIDQGAPERFCLVELGPGRGTLMSDFLRVTRQVPGFLDAAELHLIEASPVMRDTQRKTLEGFDLAHHDRLSDVPDGPLYLVANEYFDCLPIHQFRKSKDGFQEIMVVADEEELSFAMGAVQGWQAQGAFVETCPAALSDMIEIDRRISQNGGAAIIIDYGDWGSVNDTLQSIKGHAKIDPLASPGESDLTAHVDFKPLAGVLEKTQPSRMTTQGVFLERLGITKRAQQLVGRLSDEALENHIAAHRRLTHPDEMGNLFKVLGVTPKNAPLIAGLSKP